MVFDPLVSQSILNLVSWKQINVNVRMSKITCNCFFQLQTHPLQGCLSKRCKQCPENECEVWSDEVWQLQCSCLIYWRRCTVLWPGQLHTAKPYPTYKILARQFKPNHSQLLRDSVSLTAGFLTSDNLGYQICWSTENLQHKLKENKILL